MRLTTNIIFGICNIWVIRRRNVIYLYNKKIPSSSTFSLSIFPDIMSLGEMQITLGHIFAKPKDPVKTNQKTHAVYSIPCGDCEKEYLGQSKRQFGTRLKEHQKAERLFNFR